MTAILILIVTGVIALALVSVALAPLEALGWWAGWRGAQLREDIKPPDGYLPAPAEHYLVYLAGVNAISGDVIPDGEQRLVSKLRAALPGTAVVSDVFPYSVTNTGLNGNRMFAWLWRKLERLRLRRPHALLAQLIHLRNMFQVAVSADRRYGPIYNFGVAEEILAGLCRAGYRPGSRAPVTLFGWSGGAQIAVGATPFLVRALDVPVQVISLGGVITADPGLQRVSRIWHLYGNQDVVQRVGRLLFPGRWRLAVESTWNRARQEGRLREIMIGAFNHRPPRNYFDEYNRMDDGRSYADHALDALLRVLGEAGLSVRVTHLPHPLSAATGRGETSES
ncbi:MAG: hypothetical protein JJT85_05815 [Chromatiales bacterium]|nr:hypothetical protein [Chromatiales bacterium]